MINSITNTQAIIIDDMEKIDKNLPKKNNSVRTYKEHDTKEVAEKSSETAGKSSIEKPNYEKIKKEIEDKIDGNHNVNLEIVEVNEKEKMVITISNKETGETIRQIPSETSLKIMQHLYEKYGVGQITNATI